jgi:hypothetical protein
MVLIMLMMQPDQYSDHLTGGRRMGGDRRAYSYACCLPERRSGIERRCGKDRRRNSRMADDDAGRRDRHSRGESILNADR